MESIIFLFLMLQPIEGNLFSWKECQMGKLSSFPLVILSASLESAEIKYYCVKFWQKFRWRQWDDLRK